MSPLSCWVRLPWERLTYPAIPGNSPSKHGVCGPISQCPHRGKNETSFEVETPVEIRVYDAEPPANSFVTNLQATIAPAVPNVLHAWPIKKHVDSDRG